VLSQSRSTKVFAAALISIGIGAIILNILDKSPPPAGAFSLSEYYHLAPVEKVISYNIARTSHHWNSIKISYSNTKPIGTDKQSAQSSLVNYHFIIWNGLIGEDGQIQPTWKWQKQKSIKPFRSRDGSEKTIHICIIADGKITYPTDCQIKRTEMLVEALSRRFDIQPASIYYPPNWW